MASAVLPMYLPTDSSDGEPQALPGRRAVPRRLLLSLGVAALASCALTVLAYGIGLSQRVPAERKDSPERKGEEGGELAELLLEAAPDDADDGEGLAAALLAGNEGDLVSSSESYLEGLLEDGADEHDHGDDDLDAADDLAEAVQQKWAGGHGPPPWARGAARGPKAAPKAQGGPPAKKRAKKLWFVFREADHDGSGFVDGSELEALSQALRARFHLPAERYNLLYQQAGRSKDGRMSFPELKQFAALLLIFREADRDGNGRLSGEEMGVEGFALAPRLAWAVSAEAYAQLLKEADADADGELTAAELRHLLAAAKDYSLPPPMARLFTRLDSDHSKTLEGKEMESLLAILKKRFRIDPAYLESLLPDEDYSKFDRRAFKRLLVSAWGGSPFQQVGPWMLLGFFKHADKNKNLVVEGKEIDFVATGLERVFWLNRSEVMALMRSVDEDADHKLSPREFRKLLLAARGKSPFVGMCPRMAGLFKVLDKNHDRALDGAELDQLAKRFRRVFRAPQELYSKAAAAADADSDGKLRPQEFRQLLASLRSARQGAPAASSRPVRPAPEKVVVVGAEDPGAPGPVLAPRASSADFVMKY